MSETGFEPVKSEASMPRRGDEVDAGVDAACAALRAHVPFTFCGDTLVLRFRLSSAGFAQVDATIDAEWPE